MRMNPKPVGSIGVNQKRFQARTPDGMAASGGAGVGVFMTAAAPQAENGERVSRFSVPYGPSSQGVSVGSSRTSGGYTLRSSRACCVRQSFSLMSSNFVSGVIGWPSARR